MQLLLFSINVKNGRWPLMTREKCRVTSKPPKVLHYYNCHFVYAPVLWHAWLTSNWCRFSPLCLRLMNALFPRSHLLSPVSKIHRDTIKKHWNMTIAALNHSKCSRQEPAKLNCESNCERSLPWQTAPVLEFISSRNQNVNVTPLHGNTMTLCVIPG